MSFKVRKGALPEWHRNYVKGSNVEIEPFILATEIKDGPVATEYIPNMVNCNKNHACAKFWKMSDLYKTPNGGLVYPESAPGIQGVNYLANVVTFSYNNNFTDTITLTRESNTLYYTHNGTKTKLRDSCPVCLYFEFYGSGGGGSSMYDASLGTGTRAGNGGGGGCTIFGILDFAVATEGFEITLGKGGDGGTFAWSSSQQNISTRREMAQGKAGGSSRLTDKHAYTTATNSNDTMAYYAIELLSGKGGPVLNYNSNNSDYSAITKAASGGTCQKRRLTGSSAISSISSFPQQIGGIIILDCVDGAPGGVNYNDWSDYNNGNPPSTSLDARNINLAPGAGITNSSKKYSKAIGGNTYPDNNSRTYCGGGGASMVGRGGNYTGSNVVPIAGGGGRGGLNQESKAAGQAGGGAGITLVRDLSVDK
jgi:hypothetical protein